MDFELTQKTKVNFYFIKDLVHWMQIEMENIYFLFHNHRSFVLAFTFGLVYWGIL